MRQRTPTNPNAGIQKRLKEFVKMDKDELGAVRHAMTAKELDDLYKSLENSIADCTRSEVDANRDALNKVQTMIRQRMRLTTK